MRRTRVSSFGSVNIVAMTRLTTALNCSIVLSTVDD
ncbi:unnamed protein product, partial [Rotaria magnacalcarata]